MSSSNEQQRLSQSAAFVGRHWKTASKYYDDAEKGMENRWGNFIWPFINQCDFSVCVDLGAGHGRNTRKLLEQDGCKTVYCVDINKENTDVLSKRFKDEKRVTVITNNGFAIPELAANSITLFYTFDAMVHFDSDIVRAYLREVARVLKKGAGRAFLHHSNYNLKPGGDPHKNPGWRNFMSMDMFAHYAIKEGFVVEKQEKVDWLSDKTFIDGFSLLRLED
jgi:ubiquinone/menaquinone biosynthesis C-methylase UbiE